MFLAFDFLCTKKPVVNDVTARLSYRELNKLYDKLQPIRKHAANPQRVS